MRAYCVDGVMTFSLGDPNRMVVYARDPRHQVDGTSPVRYAARSDLPPNAKDSGWHHGSRELWTTPDADAVYLVSLADPTDVERWPRLKAFCD
jgi:hypothetical protein